MQHLDEGTVHAWLDGALPTTEAREVELHVAECSDCSAMVAEARGLIAGASRIVSSLDVVRGNVIPKTSKAGAGKSLWRSLHLTPSRAALAATLMIAVSTLLTVRHDTNEKLVASQEARMSRTAPAAAAVPDAPRAENAQAPAPAVPAPTAGARQTLASSEDAKKTSASRAKDREEPASKPKEAKADVATDAVAASPPVVQVPPPTAVAGAAVASANLMDSSLRKTRARAVVADSIRTEESARKSQFAPMVAQRAVTNLVAPGCFQFAEQQVAGVPQRFALAFLPGDTSQRVVRAVTENGRIDSVLAGSSWARANPAEITVRFASNERPVTLPIRDVTLGVTSALEERRDFAKRALPNVTRVPCRP
jgi:hypothetical protein